MKVFIMWSGERSKLAANALKEFLEAVVAAPRYFMSKDIGAGEVWRNVIAGELEQTHIGIAVLTPENLTSHWIHWEAGAISKSTEKNLIMPYLIGLSDTDLLQPLADMQWRSADAEGTRSMVEQINERQSEFSRTKPDALNRLFQRFWPDLEGNIKKVQAMETHEPKVQRSQESLQGEMLRRLRRIEAATDRHNMSDIDDSNPEDVLLLLKSYAENYDNVFNIQWVPSQNHFEIELNGSSEWASEKPCNQNVLKRLARPWPVYIWYSG